MPKLVEIGTNKYTRVDTIDEPGVGGACREYYISQAAGPTDVPVGEFGHVQFQNGPVKERGINGCHNEDLIAIVIHRLQGFQSGEFACDANAAALIKLQGALRILCARTYEREKRGVGGTNQK